MHTPTAPYNSSSCSEQGVMCTESMDAFPYTIDSGGICHILWETIWVDHGVMRGVGCQTGAGNATARADRRVLREGVNAL